MQKNRNFWSNFNIKLLLQDIESYGYEYSLKKFLLHTVGCFIFIGCIAYICKLQILFILILGVLSLFVFPFIVRSQFVQLYEIKRFQMVVTYLENIIPIFKSKPIITHAWQQVAELLDGDMKKVIHKAIDYVLFNTSDVHPYKTAFSMIEEAFPNSRIHAVHRMMYTVQEQNSVDFAHASDNLFFDIDAWIHRSYSFQKELKHRRNLLIFICLLTLAISCWFILVYSASDVLADFVNLLPYQISTSIFIFVMFIFITFVFIKMNGRWMVDDKTKRKEHETEEIFKKYKMTNQAKATKLDILLSVILMCIAIYNYFINNIAFATLFIISSFVLLVQKRRRYFSYKKKIKKYIEIEFPIFLREVSLNLYNMTVVNAIRNSRDTVSPILDYYILEFLENVMKDPNTIYPYDSFLKEYDLPDIRSAMKTLYNMNEIDYEYRQKQISSLIERNQIMLARSESLRNEDAILGVEVLNYIPVLLFVIQLLVVMVLSLTWLMQTVIQSIQF